MRQRSLKSNQTPRRQTSLKPAVALAASGFRRGFTAMTVAAFFGGLAEGLFLVVVTRAAFAITDGNDRVGIVAGLFLSINQTLLLGVGLVGIRVALAAFAVWQSARVSTAAVARIRRRLVGAFLSSSWSVQQDQQGGSLQQLVVNYASHARALMSGLGAAAVAAANLIAMLSLAVAIDPSGALVMVLSVVVLGVLLRPIRQAVRRRSNRANQANMLLAVGVTEVSRLGQELHVFNVQDAARSRIESRIDGARLATRRLQLASGSVSAVYSALAYGALLVALGVVAQSDAPNLTSLGAVLLVMLRSLSYGQALQGAYTAMIGAAPAIEELSEHLAVLERGHRRSDGQPVHSVGELEARNVVFSYDGEHEVLADVSFQIEPREVVGIVGPSGGGKSTLVQLLLGLRDPTSGTILAGGRDISEFAKSDWARKVTFVPQSAHMISGSIADNIRFMRDGVSSDDVEHAARLAHLHGEIVAFPEGYDRPVGEQGGHLSGGQQQRLCIARALVERPDVLILDEPTSALDVKSEHLIRTTLLELKERMTVIVIAHRLSTLDICDRIMVIQDGRLVGFDAPARLAESSEFYREALDLSGLK